jgi:hypothetical protein
MGFARAIAAVIGSSLLAGLGLALTKTTKTA